MKEIGIGIIGCGFMGKTHAYGIRNIPLYYSEASFRPTPIALYNHRLDTLGSSLQALDYSYITDDYTRILEDKRVEVVCICTPNHTHAQYAIPAFQAGKHVYLEKPVSHTLADALDIEAAWHASGKMGAMVFNNRFFPSVMRAKQLLQDGKVGRLLTAQAAYLHSGAVDTQTRLGWKHDAALCGGGSLFDLGSHVVDMLEYLAGPISHIMAELQTQAVPRVNKQGQAIDQVGEDAAYMLLRFENGARGMGQASKISTGAEDEFTIELCGELGALRLRLMDANWVEYYDNTLPDQALGGNRGWTRIASVQRFEEPGFLPAKNSVGWVRSHVHSLYRFLEAVATGQPHEPNIGQGVRVQRVLHQAVESAVQGRFMPC